MAGLSPTTAYLSVCGAAESVEEGAAGGASTVGRTACQEPCQAACQDINHLRVQLQRTSGHIQLPELRWSAARLLCKRLPPTAAGSVGVQPGRACQVRTNPGQRGQCRSECVRHPVARVMCTTPASEEERLEAGWGAYLGSLSLPEWVVTDTVHAVHPDSAAVVVFARNVFTCAAKFELCPTSTMVERLDISETEFYSQMQPWARERTQECMARLPEGAALLGFRWQQHTDIMPGDL